MQTLQHLLHFISSPQIKPLDDFHSPAPRFLSASQAGVKHGGRLLFLLGNCPKGRQTLLDALLPRAEGDYPSCTTCVNLLEALAAVLLGDPAYAAFLVHGPLEVLRSMLSECFPCVQYDRTPQCSSALAAVLASALKQPRHAPAAAAAGCCCAQSQVSG